MKVTVDIFQHLRNGFDGDELECECGDRDRPVPAKDLLKDAWRDSFTELVMATRLSNSKKRRRSLAGR